MSGYTPKPWIMTIHKGPIKYALIKVESKDRVIFDGFQGQEANALLAAASPDLLEALQSTEMALLGIVHKNQIVTNALAQARAAIEKATIPKD